MNCNPNSIPWIVTTGSTASCNVVLFRNLKFLCFAQGSGNPGLLRMTM